MLLALVILLASTTMLFVLLCLKHKVGTLAVLGFYMEKLNQRAPDESEMRLYCKLAAEHLFENTLHGSDEDYKIKKAWKKYKR
jgi:hypothetical protein